MFVCTLTASITTTICLADRREWPFESPGEPPRHEAAEPKVGDFPKVDMALGLVA